MSEVDSDLSNSQVNGKKKPLKSLPKISEHATKFGLDSDDDDDDDEEGEEEEEEDEIDDGMVTSDNDKTRLRNLKNATRLCPNFSKYLYFLFAPTLVYRDSYPR